MRELSVAETEASKNHRNDRMSLLRMRNIVQNVNVCWFVNAMRKICANAKERFACDQFTHKREVYQSLLLQLQLSARSSVYFARSSLSLSRDVPRRDAVVVVVVFVLSSLHTHLARTGFGEFRAEVDALARAFQMNFNCKCDCSVSATFL